MNADVHSDSIFLPKNRIKKLESVKKLFLIPMFFWSIIALADFLLYVIQIEYFAEVREFVGKVAFYSFPILLVYFVVATFYSSYRILESKGYKNIATFFFFQMLAYFIINVLHIEIPSYGKTTSVILTGVVCFVIVIVISLVQFRLSLPKEANKGGILDTDPSDSSLETLTIPKDLKKHSTQFPSQSLGMIISATFSIVIASMIYFGVKGGISFVTWGTFFGITLSAMIHKADKTILSMLYFLDPRGAINLFKILKLKSEVEDAQDLGEVELELGALTKAQMKTKALRLANELDQALHKVQFEEGERKIRALIDRLKDSDRLPPGEQERILGEVTDVITRLRTEQKIPQALPKPDYSSLSIGEKIVQQIGLSESEIEQALSEGLINPKQSNLWTPSNQAKIRVALKEFEEEKYRGKTPIYIANSWASFFESNRHLLEIIVTLLTSDSGFASQEIKGAEKYSLFEVVFSTAAREYSAVVRNGKDGSILVLGVFNS